MKSCRDGHPHISYQSHSGFSNAISTSRDLKTELEYILWTPKDMQGICKKTRKKLRGKKKKRKITMKHLFLSL